MSLIQFQFHYTHVRPFMLACAGGHAATVVVRAHWWRVNRNRTQPNSPVGVCSIKCL